MGSSRPTPDQHTSQEPRTERSISFKRPTFCLTHKVASTQKRRVGRHSVLGCTRHDAESSKLSNPPDTRNRTDSPLPTSSSPRSSSQRLQPSPDGAGASDNRTRPQGRPSKVMHHDASGREKAGVYQGDKGNFHPQKSMRGKPGGILNRGVAAAVCISPMPGIWVLFPTPIRSSVFLGAVPGGWASSVASENSRCRWRVPCDTAEHTARRPGDQAGRGNEGDAGQREGNEGMRIVRYM